MYATEVSILKSGIHGRMRREERGISKVTLQAARRYGMCEHTDECSSNSHHHHQLGSVVKYTYAGITFVYNPIMDKEITSYASSDYASPLAGTRCTTPILLRPKYATNFSRRESERLKHAQIRSRFFREKQASVSSHTVYVVDCSGSMRTDDVDGARCRSDAVWTSLARDCVQSALDSGSATVSDVVSVVAMGKEATTILRCDPTDWILYNTFLELREWDTLRPEGPGNYMPALVEASALLDQYDTGKQTLSLVFMSDGKPSDDGDFVSYLGSVAKRYGRRLTTTCIGIGEDGDFDIMSRMTQEAQLYGCNAHFYKATLNCASLSKILTNLSSMVVSSKLELTRPGSQLQVRKDILREKHDAPDDEELNDDWSVYESSNQTIDAVVRVWSWNRAKNDFVCLMDPRCIVCLRTVANSKTMKPYTDRGVLCGGCKACFVCHTCNGKIQHRRKHSSLECDRFLQQRRHGDIVVRPLPSFSIAIKNMFFSEGVERLVAKVRFLDPHRKFLDHKMVAKQSRFVEEENSYETRMDYHRQFLRTQCLATEMAVKFNEAVKDVLSGKSLFPVITFLEPLIFELANEQGEEVNHLVEELLVGRYEKFNNNMGFVYSQKPFSKCLTKEYCDEGGDSFPVASSEVTTQGINSLSDRIDQVFRLADSRGRGQLPPTIEDDSEEDAPSEQKVDPYEVIQAFSHFSYEQSKKNFIVVDLQGVFVDGPSPTFMLTDPAIHSRSKATRLSRLNLGRTDRGDKGVASFFKTHVCGETCRMMDLPQTEASHLCLR